MSQSNGSSIRTRRGAEGLKQIELAREMGIAQCTLSQYETGFRQMNDARFFEASAAIERLVAKRRAEQRRLKAEALKLAGTEAD